MNGRFCCILCASVSVSETTSASDFVVLILKLLWRTNLSNSLRNGGMERKGDFMYNNRLCVNTAALISYSPILTPCIRSFFLIAYNRCSIVSIYSKGGKGHVRCCWRA
ncbi:hypothetical protein XENTR_v10013918 [Xenopus tropicalis]|nr:hypothetical protein XENTR_v10013918 [Xenopus tropicalis]